jgi:hypothetical protein
MTIQEAQQWQKDLETGIQAMVEGFERLTGLEIHMIYARHSCAGQDDRIRVEAHMPRQAEGAVDEILELGS